jgi:signal transduction histidine kinase/ActR/RegA family two-component response regulator
VFRPTRTQRTGEYQPVAPPRPPARSLPATAKSPVRTRPEQVLELACRAARADQGGLGLLGADGQLAEFVTFGLAEDEAAALRRSSWPVEVVQRVLRQPLPTRGTVAECGLAGGDGPGRLPSAVCELPFLGVPILGPGRCRGALYLVRGPGAPAFGPEEEALLLPVSTWLGEGDLLGEARVLAQVRLLNRVSQASAGDLELARLFEVTLRELDRHLPLHVSAVWLLADDRGGGPAAAGSPPLGPEPAPELVLAAASPTCADLGLEPGRRLALAETPFTPCLAGGEALYTDLGGVPAGGGGPLAALLASRGANSCFSVPLRAGDRSVGILQSVCRRPTGFTADQIQLLYLAADLIGPAVSNCQLFAQLRRAYEELRVTQGQLIQSEKMRALGEMAGGMAHEFNNSLCGVLGFLELVLWDRGLPATSRGYLDSARTCALDAAETVRRVQDFARQRPHEAPVQVLDVNDLVRQTVELTRHRWENVTYVRGTPVTVRVETEAALPVSGQPTELREVLTNLIFNAVDAMPDGGTLTVRAWSTAPPPGAGDEGQVFLAVRDTGLGIREADRRRLFEPFFTTKEERGNGLGLSVAFAIVRRHGGDIAVESELGRGSTFTIRLPAAPEAAVTVPASPAAVRPAVAAGPGLRVLVVEDEESIRAFLGTCLTGLGHRPVVVGDAAAALTALAGEPFDVVLTDLGLPGASGEEVARAAAERRPAPPVVLLTGWADQLRAEQAAVEGVTRLLSKPVTIDTLRQTLAAVTQEARPAPLAISPPEALTD